MKMKTWLIDNEAAMVELGETMGRALANQPEAVTVFLTGDLGAGKTTLARGILSAFGHAGAVKSPTYTLVEAYEFNGRMVYHFDLYRLGDPEELEYVGIRDYFNAGDISLIEWPARGAGFLPQPDWLIAVSVRGVGREITLESRSSAGINLLDSV